MAYVVQNSARLLRAMFEIALSKNYANLAKTALKWVLILEKRVRPDDHPMKQFTKDSYVGKLTNPNQKITNYGYMKDDIAYALAANRMSMDSLYEGDFDSIQRSIGNHDVNNYRRQLNLYYR